jgi:hypothetical protein
MEDKRILICNVLLPGNVAMRDGSPVVYIDNDYNGNEELLFEKQFIDLLKDNNIFSTANYTGSKLVITVCSLEQVIEKTILNVQDTYTVSKLYQIDTELVSKLDYVDQVVKWLYNKVYPSLEYSFGSYKECLEYLYKELSHKVEQQTIDNYILKQLTSQYNLTYKNAKDLFN